MSLAGIVPSSISGKNTSPGQAALSPPCSEAAGTLARIHVNSLAKMLAASALPSVAAVAKEQPGFVVDPVVV